MIFQRCPDIPQGEWMMKTLIVCLFLLSPLTCYSQAHELMTGTNGNRIDLLIKNTLPMGIANAELVIKSAPSWLHFDAESITIPWLLPGQRSREGITFDVREDALNRNGRICIALKACNGHMIAEHAIEVYTSRKILKSELLPIYPNPSNPSFNIPFTIHKTSHVTICIYNVLGQSVCTLVDQKMNAGEWEFEWDGRDNDRIFVSSGIYLVVLETANDEGLIRCSSRLVLER